MNISPSEFYHSIPINSHLSDEKSSGQAYEELINYLAPTTNSRQALSKQLKRLWNRYEYVFQLKNALTQHQWDHEIFKDENFLYYALAGVQEAQLSVGQFYLLNTYWSLLQDKEQEIQSISLFGSDGQLNLKARELIEETLWPPKNGESTTLYHLSKPYLNQEEVDQFFKEMQKQDQSGQ